MKAGERWAYKAKAKSDAVEVEVLKIGASKPVRIKVRFLDDQFEGAEEWIPRARLVTPWAEVDALRAIEAKWHAIHFAGRPRGPERDAAWRVYDLLIPTEIADLYYNGAMGLTEVFDLRRFSAIVERPSDELRATRGAFEHEGSLILSWEETRRIAMDLAARQPAKPLREVAQMREEHHTYLNGLAFQDYFYRNQERNAIYTDLLQQQPMVHAEMYAYVEEWALGADQVEARRQASLEESFRELSAMAHRAIVKLRCTRTQKWNRLADEIEAIISKSPSPL